MSRDSSRNKRLVLRRRRNSLGRVCLGIALAFVGRPRVQDRSELHGLSWSTATLRDFRAFAFAHLVLTPSTTTTTEILITVLIEIDFVVVVIVVGLVLQGKSMIMASIARMMGHSPRVLRRCDHQHPQHLHFRWLLRRR